jgi:predicted nucleotidyltransferase
MENFGETLRKLRESKNESLEKVASFLSMDKSILKKIEKGQGNVKRDQVVKLAQYFKVSENDLLVSWMSDNLLNNIDDEQLTLKALKVAEEKIEYRAFLKLDRNKIVSQLKKGLKQFPKIQKAWIYGSFSRQDDGPKSDIDIAFKADDNLSYFDLAEIQQLLQNKIERKIDVGFIDAFKPYIFENLKNDLKLIYEKNSTIHSLLILFYKPASTKYFRHCKLLP